MTHPLFDGTRDLVRRFRAERRTRASLTSEEFLDAQPSGAAYPARIARAGWIELLDVCRNAPEKELDALIGEWLELQSKSAAATGQETLPLEQDPQATLPAPPAPAEDAQFIDRRYRIVRVLGEGAFGKVFLVKDKLQNDTELALKLIKREHTATSEALMRFKNEILLLRVLNHPGIPQIFNDGISEDGEFYYTMAYVSGRTLDDVIRKEAPLDPTRIVRITKQVLDVLDYAHGRGAIHRDLKPGNIFLLHAGSPKEQVRVLDFGIAKVLSREGILEHAQTMNTEMALGTPHYMSPEQVRGGDIDGRTDLYALGVIIYQMCSGRFPFTGKTLMEILAARLEKPPNPLEDSTTPAWLREVVMKLLEREREQRPDTTAIRVMLDQLQTSHRSMSRRLSWIGAAVLVIAAILLWSVFGGDKKEPDPGLAALDANNPAAEVPGVKPDDGSTPPAPGEHGAANSEQPKGAASASDSDGDGSPDGEDECPTDPKKVKPGLCGCGQPETDTDGDRTPDCVDECPTDPNKQKVGKCGCGVPDTDRDGDLVPDCLDDFPADPARSRRTAEIEGGASPLTLPAFALEKLEPPLGPIIKVAPQQKTLHVSGRASRPLASVRIGGVKVDPDPDDPARFELDFPLPPAPKTGGDRDEAIQIELVDKDELKTMTQTLNYRRQAALLPGGCSPAPDASIDDRGRVTSIVHEATKIPLALVDSGPDEPGFYLGLHEVTHEEWSRAPSRFVSQAKIPAPPANEKSGRYPAASMSFELAKDFCDQLALRLPTTSEWERAARLAGGKNFPWGDDFIAGACNSEGKQDGHAESAPVGSFEQDRCGPFLDLAGNVQEFCVDAKGAAALRGGGWRTAPIGCKLTSAGTAPPRGSVSIGFRVALSLTP